MGLKIELKPGERIIVGGSVITNDDRRTRLVIEGDVPILREKDILTTQTADTPCKRIYLAIQLLYLSQDHKQHHDVYFELVNNVVKATPGTRPYLNRINNHILAGSFYKALKEAHLLIHYEEQLVSHSKTN
jgi:flagellar biosynthesis repressor protein FlbT